MLRQYVFPLLVMILVCVSGCSGGRCTVTGTVTYDEGGAVDGGIVIGEAMVNEKLVMVQGNIEKDGTFSWGGIKAGDGALPGSYKVLVMPISLSENELSAGKFPAVDGKYTKYETSGLRFDVKDGKNEFQIKVTKPKPKVK